MTNYVSLELEIISLESDDVITSSADQVAEDLMWYEDVWEVGK